MSSLVSACRKLGVLACLGACPLLVQGQVQFNTQGGEFPVVGALAGDQVFPDVALNPYGGYLVWQDNATDGDGYGISAQKINRSLSGSLGTFRVNANAAGDQMMPRVALLTGGGAVFVWQSDIQAHSQAIARFLRPDGTFVAGDVQVSSDAVDQQLTPVVAALPDGNALVVWSSGGQTGSMLDVLAQRFSPSGEKIGPEILVNQTTPYNQRNPAVATLPNGNFIVVWISEKAKGTTQNRDENGQVTDPTAGLSLFDIDAYARVYRPDGTPVTDEFKVNSDATICANPSVSAGADGFLVVWGGKPNRITIVSQLSDGWDIFGRAFSLDSTPKGADFKVNSYTYGDQFFPKATCLNGLHFITWTSAEQDGSREGVIARLATSNGDLVSREFRVNTTTVSQQMHPVVTSNGGQDFLTIWTSFTGIRNSFDLFAQRYSLINNLNAPPAPFASPLSQSKLSVTWAPLSGYSGVHYEVYLDGSTTPAVADGNQWTATGLSAGTTHTVRLAYRLDDGRHSALSDSVTARTWGEDGNFDGLPDDWQSLYWGNDSTKWKGASDDSDGDGATNLQEFLAGTNPADGASVLRTEIITSSQGWRLQWNTQAGLIYQVQTTADGTTWTDLGTARFAAGSVDSLPVAANSTVALYRVIRVR